MEVNETDESREKRQDQTRRSVERAEIRIFAQQSDKKREIVI